MKTLRPNAKRARVAINMLWIVMAMDIISMISGYLQYGLLQSIADGILFSSETADKNDSRERVIGIVYSVTYIISAIAFIMWFRRAYYNISLKVRNFKFSDDWVAGAWFVPFVNLYRPYQIMKSMFDETSKYLSSNNLKSSKINVNIVYWWWFLWIINNIIGQFSMRYSIKAETLDELIFSTQASIFNNLIGIPLAIIAVMMIKNYYSKAEVDIIKINERNTQKEIEPLI
ncbi:DUF4328 domain-containing protein [Epilithonimonas sp.]|uniref:DUF4328 domain-containing protein n=1 Tax=Epilithonimonas sp. TaxID=2894511 RepID=UPI00289BAA61|nr:DUF4328 domain-containing protein [Epilithonimonas sp.]